MKEPRFLSVDNVLHLHARTIAGEGGRDGIRELALLESAVLMPQQRFAGVYLHPDHPAMAAAYLYQLCSNHPFVDGNKRTAFMCAYVFLARNGFPLMALEVDAAQAVIELAAGDLAEDAFANWLRGACEPL